MEKGYAVQYLGTLLVAELTENSEGVNVTQLRLTDCGRLSSSAIYPYQLKTTEKCLFEAIAEKKIVYFQELGMDFPCYLAFIKDNNTHARKKAYLLIFVNNELQLYKRVLLPTVISKERIICFDFKILDGPTILIFDKNFNSLFLCNNFDEVFNKYELTSLGIDIPSSANYHIKTIASDSDGRTLCFVESKLERGLIETSAIQFSIDGTVEKLDPFKELNALHPPTEYWQSLTAFVYHKIKFDICEEALTPSNSKKENFVMLATERKQFLVSKGYHNVCCYDIPFGDCYKIEKIEVPNCDTFFLLTSKSSQCCVVSWKQKKVIKHWTAVHDTFVGDFCHSGHSQILVLLSSVSNQNDFIYSLTDFCCCRKGLEATDSDHTQNIDVQRSLHAVKKALTNNIQSMKLKVEEKQAVYNKKRELTLETWLNMQRMSLGLDTFERRSTLSLVPLFDSESCNYKELNDQDIKKAEHPFKILEQQQFIVFDRLVVSLRILNNTDKQLSNLNLQIFFKDCLSQSHAASCSNQNLRSEMVYAGFARYPLPSSAPGDILTLTARINMPNLRAEQPIDVPLIIEWHQDDSRHSFSCCVGKATLDLKAYSDALYFPEEASLADFLQCVQVQVISSLYNLSGYLDRLRNLFQKLKCEVIVERRRFQPKSLLEGSRGRVWIFLSKSGMLAEIDIEARSIFDATQLFCILQSELPHGCVVSLPWRKQQELINKFASSMTKELSLLNRIFTYEESATEETSDMQVDMPVEPGKDIYVAKETVLRLRKQFRSKRKLAEMLLENGENLEKERDIKIDHGLYEEYIKAIESTNSAGELLANIHMANQK